MMDDAVRIVRQPGYYAFFRFLDGEGGIGRGPVCPADQRVVEGQDVGLFIFKMLLNALLIPLPLPGFGIRQPEVLQAANLTV